MSDNEKIKKILKDACYKREMGGVIYVTDFPKGKTFDHRHFYMSMLAAPTVSDTVVHYPSAIDYAEPIDIEDYDNYDGLFIGRGTIIPARLGVSIFKGHPFTRPLKIENEFIFKEEFKTMIAKRLVYRIDDVWGYKFKWFELDKKFIQYLKMVNKRYEKHESKRRTAIAMQSDSEQFPELSYVYLLMKARLFMSNFLCKHSYKIAGVMLDEVILKEGAIPPKAMLGHGGKIWREELNNGE